MLLINYQIHFVKLPKNFTFSNFYIGIKMRSKWDNNNGSNTGSTLGISIVLRKFKYTVKTCTLNVDVNEYTNGERHADGLVIDDMPDFFFTVDPDTGNENFYQTATESELLSGINNSIFDTGITSRDEYESYLQGALILGRILSILNPDTWDDDLTLYEICFIFKKSSDIKTNLYTPLHGRIFNDTFGSRKTSASLITSPVDIFEHVCRLQNLNDFQITQPSLGWGKSLPPGTLPIKISGDGSFDDSELGDLRGYDPAFQITDFESGYTDVLKRRMCQQFHMANWIDNDGYECLRRIKESAPSPSDLVTLGSVTDRTSIKIYDHDIVSLYVEPFVDYEKNPATDEMTNNIKIFNASASVYSGSFVQGLTGDAAEEVWTLCHNRWLKCKTVNKPPTDMTELIFAGGADSASISEFHLTEWINHGNLKEIEFKGHYNDFGHWEECHRYIVQFPHQTNNEQHQCIGETIMINPNPPFDVIVKGLMF
jgi:hypothetical protein